MAAKNKGGRPRIDAESGLIVETGAATQTQIAKMFGVDPKRMTALLRGLTEVDNRNGARVYDIAEAAQRIVKPGYVIEAYLKKMNHADLPPMLTTTFWDGQRKRQIFEENAGDLWRTADVIAAFAQALAAARMSLMLSRDTVERQTKLTEEQIDIITQIIDQTIIDLQETLVEEFANYEAPTDNPGLSVDGLEPDTSADQLPEAEDDTEDHIGL
ncbi:DUF1441 family protein [uncultured Sulfitobacter sp.]|uniref:DUF1441 family protein n=1 Tax=uncultured Sulfitobacter sp. TaxID=191468 RepID=UPI002591DCB0|nr:DUF1441 family protein [uncultured Sulfitobacter sp.]